jgi:FAD/FMN-containing dehydrogenase
MAELALRRRDGTEDRLTEADLDRLRNAVEGALLTPGDPDYDDARSIWNGMVDRHPGLIVRCAGAADVAVAVGLAAERGLLVSVRGGGHNIAGNAVCDGGLMIDLSGMRDVDVDPGTRTARVGPGATLGDMDAATQAYELATPLGVNSTTGVAGLTLGGGFGWLTRTHGMTVDNLRAVELITAAGERIRANERENQDLFWAVRGGGGNFGVVTSFEFDLHPVGPEVLSGLIIHPWGMARDVLRFHREFVATLPDETTVWPVLRKAPPLPFLPEQWHGREVVVLAAFHAGDPAEGEELLRPLREYGEPIADTVGMHPYVGWQQAFDPLLAPGLRNYWKSHDLAELSDAVLDTLMDFGGRLPTPHCEILVPQMGGAAGRVPADATAYGNRDTRFIVNVHTRWEQPAQDRACIGWARELFDALAPHATGSVYVNFMPADEGDRVRAGAYGRTYDRLARVKAEYDPDNLFRMNQNIRPAVHA